VPDTPVWPDRLLISLAGVAGGLGLGLVLALAIEIILRPIRDPGSLSALVGSAPLAMIPVIRDQQATKTTRDRGSFISRLWSRSR
jgi:hypothetical protein